MGKVRLAFMSELHTSDEGTTILARHPHMNTWQQAALSVYWLSTSALWCAVLIFILPNQAKQIGGAQFQGTTLGMIVLTGALVSMLVAPLFGAISDRVRTPWGRRKPFLVIGTAGTVLSLLLMSMIPGVHAMLIPYIIAFMLLELFNNIATAPYCALIPDVVPVAQRGAASGWMGLMSMLGTLIGAGAGLMINGHAGRMVNVYFALMALMVLGMLVTIVTVKEPKAPEVPPFDWQKFSQGLIAPFASRDFLWVFLTRMLVVLGTFTVQVFIKYYLNDVVAAGGAKHNPYQLFGHSLANNADSASSFFLFALLLGAVVSSLVAGTLSDRFGRKCMVYISGLLQSIVVLVFVLTGRFEIVLLMGLVFGLGYGAYQSVDWALASDVLPSEDDYAKDMGVWHVASTFPQVIAPFIAGGLLDHFQHIGHAHGLPTLGYTVIFMLAFVYFILGTVLVSKVKGAR